MQLLAGLAPSQNWPLLSEQSGLKLVTEIVSGLTVACLTPEQTTDQLRALLLNDAALQILLCYDAPEHRIAAFLAQGHTPEQAVQQWQAEVGPLLLLQQQNRRRVQLVQADAVLSGAAELPAWWKTAKNDPGLYQPPASPELLLATQLLRQHTAAATLQQRLIACSLPQSFTGLPLNLDIVQQQLGNKTEIDRLQHQLTASNQERDVLLQQLLHVQEELEQLFQKKQTVKQQYSELEQDYRAEVAGLSAKLQQGEQTVEKTASQLQHLQQELTRITAAHNSLQQQYAQATARLSAGNDERDLLLQQLLHVQEELEQLFQKKQTVKQQYSQLEQDYRTEVAGLSAKLQQGEQTVEKTAGQLHRLQDELNRVTSAHNALQQQCSDASQQLTVSNEDRVLLQQQLFHVQEELEHYYLKNQQSLAVQKKQKKLEQQVEKLQGELTKATAEFQAELAKATAAYQAEHKQTISLQKQHERSQSKIEQQLKVAIADAARARQHAISLESELNAIKNSALWKSGAPVRKLATVLNKNERKRLQRQQEAALIITSEYFDIQWYLNSYPDVAEAKMNPAEHYLRFGAAEGRYPGPLFDGNWYLQHNPDVASAGINPLLHYIKFGQAEGRKASPILLANNQQADKDSKKIAANSDLKAKIGKGKGV